MGARSAMRMGGMGGWRPWRAGRRLPLPGAQNGQYGFYFDPRRHDFSEQIFLGRSYGGSAGIVAGEAAPDVLAASPATARHLSYQLAQYFVADNPPQRLVERVAERFARSQGDIRAALETLFFSPEFWDQRYCGAKFKTPYDYVISAARVAGISDITNYRPLFGTMALLGMPPYGRETPDGYANTRAAWLNPDAMMTRLGFATALGQGHLPLIAPPFEAGGGGEPLRVKFKGRGGAPDAAGPACHRDRVRPPLPRRRPAQPRLPGRARGARKADDRARTGHDRRQQRRAFAQRILQRHRPPRPPDCTRPKHPAGLSRARRMGHARQSGIVKGPTREPSETARRRPREFRGGASDRITTTP